LEAFARARAMALETAGVRLFREQYARARKVP
jgi:hypothetical protein